MAQIIKISNFENRLKGDTFPSVTFTLTDSLGDPTDLTGATLLLQFRRGSELGAIALQVTDGAGLTVATPTSGIVVLDSWEPITWEIGVYYYDLQITFAGTTGKIKTPVKGTVEIEQDTSNI